SAPKTSTAVSIPKKRTNVRTMNAGSPPAGYRARKRGMSSAETSANAMNTAPTTASPTLWPVVSASGSTRGSLRRGGEQPALLATPVGAQPEHEEDGDHEQWTQDDQRGERNCTCSGEERERSVRRTAEEAAVMLGHGGLLGRQRERDPRHRRRPQRRRVRARNVGEAPLRLVELELQTQPHVGRQRLLQRGGDACDLELQLQNALPLRADDRIQILDRDVLLEHGAERRQPDQRALHVRNRNAQHEIGFPRSS